LFANNWVKLISRYDREIDKEAMKIILITIMLIGIVPAVSWAQQEQEPEKGLSTEHRKTIQQVGKSVLMARKSAIEDPEIQQLRTDIKTLQQELRALRLPVTMTNNATVIESAGEPSIQATARLTGVQAQRNATKQHVRDVMEKIKQEYSQVAKRSKQNGHLYSDIAINLMSEKITKLHADIESALAKPDKELHADLETLLKRVETRRLMIGKALDDQPTLTTRIHHRR
jgi:hypothetical protein